MPFNNPDIGRFRQLRVRLIGVLLIIPLFFFSSANTTLAAGEPTNSKNVSFVPMRTVLQSMDVPHIEWLPESQEARFIWNGSEYFVVIGQKAAYKNGETIRLLSQPYMHNQAILVPIDFFEMMEDHEMKKPHSLFVVDPHETKLDKSIREEIIKTARTYLGVPYVWGGFSPKGFDSSGFIGYVFKKNGISIPRVSTDIYKRGKKIPLDELLPGDLIFFEGYKSGPSHGTIYIGNNQIIHSPGTGKKVSITTWVGNSYWEKNFYGVVRYIES